MQLKDANFLGPELLGRPSEMLGETSDLSHVAFDGAWRTVAEGEVFDEATTQRRHDGNSTTSCAG
jgi:hypothetical protein